jgi:hypothetical protein
MGQPVIVVPGQPAESPADASAAFAAGVAAATATQAEETAQAAAVVAAEAVEQVENVQGQANAAFTEALDASIDVAELRVRLTRLEDIVDDVTEALTMDDDGQGEPDDPTLPPKVTVTVDPEPEPDSEKPAPKSHRGFGSKAWFGTRE